MTFRTDVPVEGKTIAANALVFVLCGGDCRKCFYTHSLTDLCCLRGAARGEIYAYVPLNDNNTQRLLEVLPESHKNPDYGFSVGRGAFTFPKGTWTTVAERVRLNKVGQADGQSFLPPNLNKCFKMRLYLFSGEVELWVNGSSVIKATGLILRDEEASHIKGMHFQTFFGGAYFPSDTTMKLL